MVIGGQAVLLYGDPRLTKDIDITLGIDVDGLPKVERIVKALSLKALVGDAAQFVKQNLILPVLHEPSGIRIDFIFSFSPYEQQAIMRSRSIKIGGSSVKFSSPEDTIIQKLVAGRPRDLDDVKSIMRRQTAYDDIYVKKWLGEFSQIVKRNLTKEFEQLKSSVR